MKKKVLINFQKAGLPIFFVSNHQICHWYFNLPLFNLLLIFQLSTFLDTLFIIRLIVIPVVPGIETVICIKNEPILFVCFFFGSASWIFNNLHKNLRHKHKNMARHHMLSRNCCSRHTFFTLLVHIFYFIRPPIPGTLCSCYLLINNVCQNLWKRVSLVFLGVLFMYCVNLTSNIISNINFLSAYNWVMKTENNYDWLKLVSFFQRIFIMKNVLLIHLALRKFF